MLPRIISSVVVFLLLSCGAANAADDEIPQLPGFDVESEPEPLPSFGKVDDRFLVEVVDGDRRTAADRFRRYDLDRDGYLSRDELTRNRWDGQPLDYDRNGDGRLSPEEMAFRYANMRIAKEAGRQQGETDRLMKFYSELDTNGNKVLEPREVQASRYRDTVTKRIREAGMDPAKPIPLRDFMEQRLRNAGVDAKRIRKSVKFIPRAERIDASASRSQRDDDRDDDRDDEERRKSYRVLSAHDRLPKSVPDWFREKDRNFDGQVSMAEYGRKWTEQLAEEFRERDQNNDGFITPAESIDDAKPR